jgi:hypothetical protein
LDKTTCIKTADNQNCQQKQSTIKQLTPLPLKRSQEMIKAPFTLFRALQDGPVAPIHYCDSQMLVFISAFNRGIIPLQSHRSTTRIHHVTLPTSNTLQSSYVNPSLTQDPATPCQMRHPKVARQAYNLRPWPSNSPSTIPNPTPNSYPVYNPCPVCTTYAGQQPPVPVPKNHHWTTPDRTRPDNNFC